MENQDVLKILQSSENHIVQLQNAIELLQNENSELKAENETWNRISECNDAIEMSAVAKELNYKIRDKKNLLEEMRFLKYYVKIKY